MKSAAGLTLTLHLLLVSCSSSPEVRQQKYAKLSNEQDFEEDRPIVWKGIIDALSDYKIQNPNEEKGTVETDWIYSTSNEKYVEYAVNGFPRRHYLKVRYRYKVLMEPRFDAVHVRAETDEEIEELRSDGTPKGWSGSSDPDSSRRHDLIKKIEFKILGRAP